MRRLLILVFAFGALTIAGPDATHGRTAASFRQASHALVSEGYEALGAEKSWNAILLFEKAVVADPHNIDAYIGLGKAHEALQSISGGLKYYGIAIGLDPLHLAAWEAKLLAHLVLADLDEAEAALLRMKAICGENSCPEASRAKAAIDVYQAKIIASASKP